MSLKKEDALKTDILHICNVISEYGRLDSDKEARVLWIKENCEAVIETNAIGKIKKL